MINLGERCRDCRMKKCLAIGMDPRMVGSLKLFKQKEHTANTIFSTTLTKVL